MLKYRVKKMYISRNKNIFRCSKPVFPAFLLVFLLLMTGNSGSFGREPLENASAKTSEDTNPVNALRDSTLSYFYPVSGTVIMKDGETVIVSFRKSKELKKGMRLSVYREDKPFYHPVTKEPIGKTESLTGRVEIEKKLEDYKGEKPDAEIYLCKIISDSPGIDDTARIPSSVINLAFFQDKNTDWALSEAYFNVLKDSGRFHLLESYTKTLEPQELSRLARGLKAEVFVLFSTLTRDNNIFLNSKLFWAEDAEPFAEIEEMVGPALIREFSEMDELISAGFIEGEPWGSYRLEGGRLIAMGDVDGNDVRELIVSDGHAIRVYEYKQEPRELSLIKGNSQERHLSLDVLDLNNNGKAEIYVTSLLDIDFDPDLADGAMKRKESRNQISSFVFEYDTDAGYRRIWHSSSYVTRVIGKSLLMQEYSPYRSFTGPVYKVTWKDGQYKTGEVIDLPEGINIYGFTYMDPQDTGKGNILAFDENGYLNLYHGSEVIWKSKGTYGQFDTELNEKSYSVSDPDRKTVVRGRLLTVKTEKGREVMVVKRIPYINRLKGFGYRKAEVYSFWWDGDEMVKTLILGDIDGSVTDYWLEGDTLLLIGEPNLFMFLKGSLSGDIMKKSILYFYNLEGK
jgi:hypothetical protein